GATAGAQRQSRGQSVPAGDVSTGPAGGHVLYRRCQGRLRADQGPRRRVHHAAHRRYRFDHCETKRYLRQSHSAHPTGALLSKEKKMTNREQYTPGPASGAQVRKDGEKWTLILVRELRHSPEKVWQALTDPVHLREWAPFDVNGSLGTVGTVNLSWVGAPTPIETKVTRADAPKLLEYDDTRWELEPSGSGTRLTLWHNIDRRFISWGAAGWHISFDVLDRLLGGIPIGPLVGADAVEFGWQRRGGGHGKP